MLIVEEIEGAKRKGLLFPVKVIAPWAGARRAFLKCMALHEAMEIGKSDPDEKTRRRWAQLEAAMSHFVEGGFITDGLVKQLQPPKYEHWELKNKRPKPSLRVFGRFAMPDVFIGTHVLPRKNLKGMWSAEFEQEKLVSEDHYRRAGLTSFFSDELHFRYEKYITENASRKPRIER